MAPSFAPSGVITLTTDFGHKGPFVATMKGVMLTRFAEARIIDLTHEIDVHFPAEAGFWLARSYAFFPSGTTHVAVVDPGVGTERDVVLLLHDGHVFLAPDNGLLAPLAGLPGARAHRLDPGRAQPYVLPAVSATFHGRDVFAPLAAEIAAGRVRVEDLGPHVASVVPSWVDEPEVSELRVSGSVIAVDNFGNLITNITAAHLGRFRRPVVRAGGHDLEVRRTYGDVRPGEALALVNSFGALEIARSERSAAESLGLSRGAPVTVREHDG
jgi:S-adenosylmethionine hydrolase